MVDLALGDCWAWVARGYAPFDFKHRNGTRLKVKQASYQQTWETTVEPAPRFDVAKRTGFYEQNKWHKVDPPQRNADLYVFSYHVEQKRSLADHRRAAQWAFAIVDAINLTDERSLSYGRVSAMSEWYRSTSYVRRSRNSDSDVRDETSDRDLMAIQSPSCFGGPSYPVECIH